MFQAILDWYQPLHAPLHRVDLMRFSATPKLLPRRCVITGETRDVVYKSVYVPNQTGGWVRLTLPFTMPALKRWYMALNLFALSLAVSLIAFCASVYVAWCGGAPGILLFVAGIALPVLTKQILLSGSGPELLYARNDVLALLVPAQKTAEEMRTAVDGIECIMDRFVKIPVPPPRRVIAKRGGVKLGILPKPVERPLLTEQGPVTPLVAPEAKNASPEISVPAPEPPDHPYSLEHFPEDAPMNSNVDPDAAGPTESARPGIS